MRSSRSLALGLAALAIHIATLAPVFPTSLFVDVAGDNANDCLTPATACQTIPSAIYKSTDGDQIIVLPGTYSEPFQIVERHRLSFVGGPGVHVADLGATGGALIGIIASNSIRFSDVVFTGHPSQNALLVVDDSRSVRFERCTIQQAPVGILTENLSTLLFADGVIQDTGTGIRVDGGSNVILDSAPFSAGETIVRRNASGVRIRNGSVNARGGTLFDANGAGISSEGGAVTSCCGSPPRQFTNNFFGIAATGGSLRLEGDNLFSENESVGIALTGGSGTLGFGTVFQNNRGFAAISVSGAHLSLRGVVITANDGIGVAISDSGFLQIFEGTEIADNQGGGVLLERVSTVFIGEQATLQGNSTFDLYCRSGSHAFGVPQHAEKCVWSVP